MTGDVAASLTTATGQGASNTGPSVLISAGFKSGNGAKARSIGWEEEKIPTLASEAGGDSVPSVCIKTWDARGNGDGETVSTITGDHENRITDYTSVICMAHGQSNAEIMENLSPTLNCNHEQPIACYSIQGNTIDRDAKQNGSGVCEGVAHTLNAVDLHGVAYDASCVVFDKEVYNSGENATGGHYIAVDGPAPTLRGTGHPPGCCVQYIVRRLTPVECARLQGFADGWGEIDPKEDLTDEEYRLWLDVRNTHAAINGKAVKDYTKKQMLTWYNKLHTNSSEYRMWGNGVALPPTLYVMQGICDAAERG